MLLLWRWLWRGVPARRMPGTRGSRERRCSTQTDPVWICTRQCMRADQAHGRQPACPQARDRLRRSVAGIGGSRSTWFPSLCGARSLLASSPHTGMVVKLAAFFIISQPLGAFLLHGFSILAGSASDHQSTPNQQWLPTSDPVSDRQQEDLLNPRSSSAAFSFNPESLFIDGGAAGRLKEPFDRGSLARASHCGAALPMRVFFVLGCVCVEQECAAVVCRRRTCSGGSRVVIFRLLDRVI